MKKWLVIVNKEYLVSVEAETNGGAEHRILDQILNVDTALAFDPITEGHCETYWTLAAECETVSFGELCHLSNMEEYRKRIVMNSNISAVEEQREHLRGLICRYNEGLDNIPNGGKAFSEWQLLMKDLAHDISLGQVELEVRSSRLNKWARDTGLPLTRTPQGELEAWESSYSPNKGISSWL